MRLRNARRCRRTASPLVPNSISSQHCADRPWQRWERHTRQQASGPYGGTRQTVALRGVDRGRSLPVPDRRPPHPRLHQMLVCEPADAYGVWCRRHRHRGDPMLAAIVLRHPGTDRVEPGAFDGRADRVRRQRVPGLFRRRVPIAST